MHKALAVGVLLALTSGLSVVGYTQEVTESLSGDQLSYVILYLNDGGVLGGHIVASDENTITIEPSSGGKIIIPRDGIKEIKQGRLAGINIGSKEQKYERPPLSGVRIASEIIAGGVGGFAVGVPSALIGARLTYDPSDWLGLSSLFGALIGWGIGYPLGSAFGVYLAGNIGDETGSFFATWGGAFAGLLLALPAGKINDTLAGIVLIAGPPIVATYCFNASRRYDYSSATSETGLINYKDGQMSLAVPRVYFRPDSSGIGGLSRTVDLLRVRF